MFNDHRLSWDTPDNPGAVAPAGTSNVIGPFVANRRSAGDDRRPWHVVLGLILPMTLLIWNMLRVRSFTIDDAYISYRYARNFARGLGLVYNPGEHIEGYTNFLWTVVLGAGMRLNLDPEALAKILGGLASCGSLYVVFLLSRRLRPYTVMPCVATWLMATSIVQSGYAVFGLETSAFTFFVLAGCELFFRERDRPAAMPYSGLMFGLAGLTRPEAPMFIGILMLFLGRRLFDRQNLLRGVLFAAPIAVHLLWRHSYYDAWLPNTLAAKTGSLGQQLRGGSDYLGQYLRHTWPVWLLALIGVGVAQGVTALSLMALALAVLMYVLLVGGDWMPYFRFLGPFEPFFFLFACLGIRAGGETVLSALTRLPQQVSGPRRRALAVSLGVVAIVALASIGYFRADRLTAAQQKILTDDKVFWDSAAGRVAQWLVINDQPGEIAVADIGYIGYATDYPLLDLLGLVDPVIAKLPGGYTRKYGPGYVERVFDKEPRYFVFVGGARTCSQLPFPAQEKLRRDERFQSNYKLVQAIAHSKGGVWCIFERRGAGARVTAG